VLRLKVDTTTFETKAQGAIPHLLVTAVHDRETGTVSLFALNRSTTEEMTLDIDLRGVGEALGVAESLELHDADLKKINSKTVPDAIAPAVNATARIEGSRFTATLKAQSWNVFALKTP